MRLLTGMRAWVVQRITALLLLAFVLWFAARLIAAPPDGYEAWRALVAQPVSGVALAIGFGALLLHAWVGVRDVVLDYVHGRVLRATVLVAVAIALSAIGIGVALALAGQYAR